MFTKNLEKLLKFQRKLNILPFLRVCELLVSILWVTLYDILLKNANFIKKYLWMT